MVIQLCIIDMRVNTYKGNSKISHIKIILQYVKDIHTNYSSCSNTQRKQISVSISVYNYVLLL
jgi:hypothetical protein